MNNMKILSNLKVETYLHSVYIIMCMQNLQVREVHSLFA